MAKQDMGRLLPWLLALLLVLLLGGQARAAGDGEDGEPPTLPRELLEAAPEAAEALEEDGAGGFDLAAGVSKLWASAVEKAKDYLFSGVRSVAAIMAGVVALGAAESMIPDYGGRGGRWVTAVGALWVTAVSAGDIDALIGLGRETVGEVATLTKLLLPALAAATAAGGGVTAASARQVAAVLFSDVLLTVIDSLLLPMVYLYIGVAAAGAVLEENVLETIGELLKKVVVWVLSGLLVLFTTFLTVSGAIAGHADAQAVRLAKSAVSAAVPVVGGILSDAAESVMVGAGILKGMLGAFGALAVLSACLVPFLRLGCQYLLYQGAGLVAGAAGPKNLTALLRKLGDAFGLVLAMTGTSALLLIITLVSSLTAVTP